MDDILKIIDKNLSNEEIFQNLKNETCQDFEKIFSIINLDELNSQEEFDILIENLTDKPTPIREMTSIKLEEFKYTYSSYFLGDFAVEKILKGIIDINPNVSRSICNIIISNENLQNILEEKIIEKIDNLMQEIKKYEEETKDYFDKTIRNTKNHAKNKKLFSLYWYLEALSCSISQKNNEKILNILTRTVNFLDYTIREKTAKILLALDNCPIDLIEKIRHDENFYVKNQVYDKMN